MNAALLYKSRRRWLFWAAFACASAIQVGAVVVANGKSDKPVMRDFKPAGIDVEVEKEPEQVPPEQPLASPPPEQLAPEKEAFPPEDAKLPQSRPLKKTRTVSLVRAAVKGTVAQFGSVKSLLLYAPRPVYPYEAPPPAHNRIRDCLGHGGSSKWQHNWCSNGAELWKPHFG